jgi:hypothetical protein
MRHHIVAHGQQKTASPDVSEWRPIEMNTVEATFVELRMPNPRPSLVAPQSCVGPTVSLCTAQWNMGWEPPAAGDYAQLNPYCGVRTQGVRCLGYEEPSPNEAVERPHQNTRTDWSNSGRPVSIRCVRHRLTEDPRPRTGRESRKTLTTEQVTDCRRRRDRTRISSPGRMEIDRPKLYQPLWHHGRKFRCFQMARCNRIYHFMALRRRRKQSYRRR